MNEAMAKLTTFTQTTLTPTPAADRSLARTASMAEPSELRRRRATPERDERRASTRHEQAEADAWEGVADCRCRGRRRTARAARRWRRPASTMWVLRNHTASMA